MLEQLKLKNRILVGYSIPLAMLLGLNALVFVNNQRISRVLQENKISQKSVQLINGAHIGISRADRALRGYLLGSKPSLESYKTGLKNFRSYLDKASEIVTDEQQKARLAKIKTISEQLVDFDNQMLALVQSGKSEEAIQLFGTRKGVAYLRELEDLSEKFTEAQEKFLNASNQEAEATNNFLNLTYSLASLTAIAIGLLSAYAIASGIAKTLKNAADKVTTSSSLISETVEQQERIVIEQAASVSETSSTIDQLGFVSLQSAQQAEESAEGARKALNLAEEGTKSVEETMETMAKLKERIEAIARQIMTLSEQTTQIDKVSSLVGDLANQTNMLALNAAVEASRAGESGKGFGVVATEIRKLADESKKSAAKINTLITDVQSAMNSTVMVTDEGTKTADASIQLARETVNAFLGVSEAVNSVFSNSYDISQSAKQQAVAVQEVVAAINALNLGAQETTDSIAQVRNSTEELNEAARQLETVI
jgi:methyl-accepting chemotaxis protein